MTSTVVANLYGLSGFADGFRNFDSALSVRSFSPGGGLGARLLPRGHCYQVLPCSARHRAAPTSQIFTLFSSALANLETSSLA